jgi:hypothetical protein
VDSGGWLGKDQVVDNLQTHEGRHRLGGREQQRSVESGHPYTAPPSTVMSDAGSSTRKLRRRSPNDAA